jgi:hypothetical protein
MSTIDSKQVIVQVQNGSLVAQSKMHLGHLTSHREGARGGLERDEKRSNVIADPANMLADRLPGKGILYDAFAEEVSSMGIASIEDGFWPGQGTRN